jgi:hypothetical protein
MSAKPVTGQEGGPYGQVGPCIAHDNTRTQTQGCTDIGLTQNPPFDLDNNTQGGCEGGPASQQQQQRQQQQGAAESSPRHRRNRNWQLGFTKNR